MLTSISHAQTYDVDAMVRTANLTLCLLILLALFGKYLSSGRSVLLHADGSENRNVTRNNKEHQTPPVIKKRKHTGGKNRQEYNVTFFEDSVGFYWTDTAGNRIYDGVTYRFRQALLEVHHNIRLHYIPASSYYTLIANVESGLADFSLTTLYFTQERYRFAEYSFPLHRDPYCLVMQSTPNLRFGAVLLLPYRVDAWLGLLITFLAASFTWHAVRRQCSGDPLIRGRTFQESMLTAFQTALVGGCHLTPRNLSQRTALASLLLFSLVLCNAYSGKLFGFLAALRPADPQTLREALSALERVFVENDLIESLKGEFDDAFLSKFAVKPEYAGKQTLETILSNKRNGVCVNSYDAFVLLTSPTMVKDKTLHRVPECVSVPGFGGLIVRKNHSFYEPLNRFSMRVVEAALYDHWIRVQRHHMEANGVIASPDGRGTRHQPLTLKQMRDTMFLLLLSLGSTCFVFFTELLLNCPKLKRVVDETSFKIVDK